MSLLMRYLSLLLCCIVWLHIAHCQSCYYPNGDLSKDGDIPCSSAPGSPCCPLNWECLSNGLCHLANANYLGRYTCTDRTWQSSGCPNICTHSNTASGNEAILECSQGKYCCDANRPSVGCCDTNAPLFPLAALSNGNGPSSNSAGAAGGGSAPPSGSNSPQPSASSSSPPSSTSSSASSSNPASSASPSIGAGPASSSASDASAHGNVAGSQSGTTNSGSSASSPGSSLTVITSVVTNTVGSAIATNTLSASAQQQDSSQSSSKTSLGGTIGPAVGVPIGVIALVALALLLWRRRRNKRSSQAPHPHAFDPKGHDIEPFGFVGKPELDSSYAGTPTSPRHDRPESNSTSANDGGRVVSGLHSSYSPTLHNSPNQSQLSGSYAPRHGSQIPETPELPGSRFHPYSPNIPRELPG